MEALSHTDGSAAAVREAADAAPASADARPTLERELDRLNLALEHQAGAMASHLHALMLSQGFMLVAYLLVLVGGWGVALPGKRLLLVGIAGVAAAFVVLHYVALRASRDRIGPLRDSRRHVEEALRRLASRTSSFSRQHLLAVVFSGLATRLVAILAVCGWTALMLYTMALPMPGALAANASTEARPERAAPTSATAGARAPRAVRKVDDTTVNSSAAPTVSSSAAPVDAPADDESPLSAFFRRALNSANTAPAEQGDRVTP
jgi:hypothetical protein